MVKERAHQARDKLQQVLRNANVTDPLKNVLSEITMAAAFAIRFYAATTFLC